MTTVQTGKLAVALHEVEPATLERCRHIREWLYERGVDRATLLVIPARDLHPLAGRSPNVAGWLLERRRTGDSIAQHGFQHPTAGARRNTWSVGLGSSASEFAGMDMRETRRAVDAGWRVLKLAGIDPDGFVAPGYAYTPALREVLRRRFRWWAELLGVRHVELAPHVLARPASTVRNTITAPPLAPASASGLQRSLSRALLRMEAHIEALLPDATLRLDVHPHDFDRPSRVAALDRLLLALVEDRRAITYDELALGSVTSSETIGSSPSSQALGSGTSPEPIRPASSPQAPPQTVMPCEPRGAMTARAGAAQTAA